MIQSKEKFEDRKFTAIKNLNKNLESQTVWLRGRLHTSRAKGNVTVLSYLGNKLIVIICAYKSLMSRFSLILQASNALSC